MSLMDHDESSEFFQPERPKLRFRSEAESSQTASSSESVSAPTPEQTRQQISDARRLLSAWGDVEPIPVTNQQVVGVVIGAVLAIVVAVVVSLDTAIVSAVIGVAVTASVGRLAGWLRAVKVPSRMAGVAACVLAVVLLGTVLFVGSAVWQRQAAQYGARLCALAREAAGLAAKHAETKTAGHWLVRGTTSVETALNQAAATVAERRVKLWIQLTLWVGALTGIGLLRPRVDATGWVRGWGFLAGLLVRFFSKIGFWMSSRLAKAVVLVVLTGGGLQMAGVTAVWFVAGGVLVLALVVRSVAIFVLIAVIPMVPWGAEWMKAGGIALGTCVVLYFAEKKLHWYLYLRPALASGLILPETHGGEEGHATRSLVGGIWKTVRLATSAALLVVTAGLLWVFIPAFLQKREQQQAVMKAAAMLESNALQATAELLKLAERYPDAPETLLELTKAYWLTGDTNKAMQYAESYAKWEPKPVDGDWRAKWYRQLLAQLKMDQPTFNRAEGYEFLLRQDKSTLEVPSKPRRALAEKIIALNPDSLIALAILANECLMSNETDKVIEYAGRGARLNPRDPAWHQMLADAYLQKKEYARAMAACDAALALNPDDSRSRNLRGMAERLLKQSKP